MTLYNGRLYIRLNIDKYGYNKYKIRIPGIPTRRFARAYLLTLALAGFPSLVAVPIWLVDPISSFVVCILGSLVWQATYRTLSLLRRILMCR